MFWTSFKTIGHSSKTLGRSQKSLCPCRCPKLVTGLFRTWKHKQSKIFLFHQIKKSGNRAKVL